MPVKKAVPLDSKIYDGKLASKGNAKVGLYVRFQSREQFEFIRQAAQACGRSLNYFFLESACRRAKQILR